MTEIEQYNYRTLRKLPKERLQKLYECSIADKEIYIKKMKERNHHYRVHIKQADEVISIVCKIMIERCKDESNS
jgi:hypothetical protein